MATLVIREGDVGSPATYDVRVSENTPTTVDATPTGVTEIIRGDILGSANRLLILTTVAATITAGSTINSATFFAKRSIAGTETHSVQIYRQTYVGWDETGANTATWNLHAIAGSPASLSMTADTAFHSSSITAIVQDAVTSRSGVLALCLKEDDETGGFYTETCTIHSSDAAASGDRWYIEIDYTLPVVTGPSAAIQSLLMTTDPTTP